MAYKDPWTPGMAGSPAFFASLRNAQKKLEEQYDTGPVSYTAGSPRGAEDFKLSDTGALAGFPREVDKNWKGYFGPYRDKLIDGFGQYEREIFA